MKSKFILQKIRIIKGKGRNIHMSGCLGKKIKKRIYKKID